MEHLEWLCVCAASTALSEDMNLSYAGAALGSQWAGLPTEEWTLLLVEVTCHVQGKDWARVVKACGGGGDGRRRGKGWPAPAEHQTYNLEGLAPGLRKGIATRRGPMPVQEAKPNEDTKRIADEGNCMEVPEEGQEDTLVESAEAVLAEDVCRLAKGSVAYPNAAAEGNVELGTLFGEVNRRALDEVMVAEAEEPLLDRTHDLRGLRLRALEAKVEELGDIFGKALPSVLDAMPALLCSGMAPAFDRLEGLEAAVKALRCQQSEKVGTAQPGGPKETRVLNHAAQAFVPERLLAGADDPLMHFAIDLGQTFGLPAEGCAAFQDRAEDARAQGMTLGDFAAYWQDRFDGSPTDGALYMDLMSRHLEVEMEQSGRGTNA